MARDRLKGPLVYNPPSHTTQQPEHPGSRWRIPKLPRHEFQQGQANYGQGGASKVWERCGLLHLL